MVDILCERSCLLPGNQLLELLYSHITPYSAPSTRHSALGGREGDIILAALRVLRFRWERENIRYNPSILLVPHLRAAPCSYQ
jgi:hypothetical protein